MTQPGMGEGAPQGQQSIKPIENRASRSVGVPLGGKSNQERPPQQSFSQLITPLRIENLDEFVSSNESWGGNAGRNSAVGNAYYRNGEFHFSNNPDEYSNSLHVMFYVRLPSLSVDDGLRMIKEGKATPPTLIDEVRLIDENPQQQKLFTQRALQHNAFKITEFLKRGGDISLLPPTPLMPNLEELRRYIDNK